VPRELLLQKSPLYQRSILVRYCCEADIAGGIKRFVEEVALGPGTWEQLPEELRQMFINNASTFLDEQQDAKWVGSDLSGLSRFSSPAF